MILSKMKLSPMSLTGLILLIVIGCSANHGVSDRLPSKNFRARSQQEALDTWKGKSVNELVRVWGPPDTLIRLLDSTEKVARYMSRSSNYEYQGDLVGKWYGTSRNSRSTWSDSLSIVDFFIDGSNTITHARSEGNIRLYWYPSTEKVVTTQSGLGYVEYEIGTGAIPKNGDRVIVHFTGMLTDSSIFDSSILPEFDQTEPYGFTLGEKEAILGLEEGVSTMRVGGKRKLIVPPHLAYGASGNGEHIYPNATLVFYVHLVGVE
jgi:hypothetical protein